MNCGEKCKLECPNTGSEIPMFMIALTADFQKGVSDYTIDTLDMMIGTIGGFIGLVYMIFGVFISGYEDFKREISLVKSFYSTNDEEFIDETESSCKFDKLEDKIEHEIFW